jgi:hypothetical protein
MRVELLIVAGIVALVVACTGGEEQIIQTPSPPTGGPDPMTVETLAGRTVPGTDISVVGYIVNDQVGARLCDVLLESFPPQCGPIAVEIADYENLGIGFEDAQKVRWTENKVALRGSWSDGVFTPTGLLD